MKNYFLQLCNKMPSCTLA